MDFSKVFENNKKWVEEKLSLNPNYFEDLAKDNIRNSCI